MKTVWLVLCVLTGLGLALNESYYYVINLFGALIFFVCCVVTGSKLYKKRG